MFGYHTIELGTFKPVPMRVRKRILSKYDVKTINIKTPSPTPLAQPQQPREEEYLYINNLITELNVIKQRLHKTLLDAEKINNGNQIGTSGSKSHWMYGTVTCSFPLGYKKQVDSVNIGYLKKGDLVLVCNNFVENSNGIWIQIKHNYDPFQLFYVPLMDEKGNMNIDHFRINP